MRYADLFDAPTHLHDIHRNLIGESLTLLETSMAVDDLVTLGQLIRTTDDLVCLAGRTELLEHYDKHSRAAENWWSTAHSWGDRLGQLPLVRMVAVTGRGTLTPASPTCPIDFFIVTRPRRLWLTRAMIGHVIGDAERRGITLRISMMTTTRSLEMQTQNLFVAHALTNMAPIVGRDVFHGLRACNQWMQDFLPNSATTANQEHLTDFTPSGTQKWLEWLLLLPPFRPLEIRTRRRAIASLMVERNLDQANEVAFSPDCCTGDFADVKEDIKARWLQLIAAHTCVSNERQNAAI